MVFIEHDIKRQQIHSLFLLLTTVSLLLCANSVYAQSLSYAKSLISQGRYLDAAKQLRPLADNGDAEAQFIAAELFYAGKGVKKNNEQAFKYATKSADQGYENAVVWLLDHYTDDNKKFSLAKKSVSKYPHFINTYVGLMLGWFYINGIGTEKNENMGWTILSTHPQFDVLLSKYPSVAESYFKYQAHQQGKQSIEEYADYLFGTFPFESDGNQRLYKYFELLYGDSIESHYEEQAGQGNAFALAMYAKSIMNNNKDLKNTTQLKRAQELALSAKEKGSKFGKYLYDDIKN